MANHLVPQDYCNMVVDFVNKKYGRVFNSTFTEKDIVEYCVSESKELDDGDAERILHIVVKCLSLFLENGYVCSANPNRTKFITSSYIPRNAELIVFEDERQMRPINDQMIQNLNDIDARTKYEWQSMDSSKFISSQECASFDWSEFGRRLKQEQLLPPSYDKKPTSVTIGLDKSNQLLVELIFKSKTSESVRKLVIYQNANVREYVNGSCNSRANTTLINTWLDFRHESLIAFKRKQDQGICTQASEARRLLEVEKIPQVEREFINMYRNANFYGFYWGHEPPYFVSEHNKIARPMTPKTLEFCVLKLIEEAREEEREDIEFFERKCKRLEELSVYKTPQWNSTIEFLKRVMQNTSVEEQEK